MPYEKWELPELPDEYGRPFRSRRCLAQMVTPRAAEMIFLHRFWRQGVMLQAGGIYDQPHAYVEAMQILDGILGAQPHGRS